MKARLFGLGLFLTFSGAAKAAPEPSIPYMSCFEKAADKYGLNPLILAAMAEQESSFNPKALNESESSRAVGLMQIHSWWFPLLEEQYRISEDSLYEPCLNIQVGAWILAQKVQRYGNTWRAVGSYFAGTARTDRIEKLRDDYANSVARRYGRLIGGLLLPATAAHSDSSESAGDGAGSI